ncbi:MAG: hypothetical protein LBH73_03225 [Spirochaetaceae bacterium]|nr:hypothetical protein [Spirochaetaceae bacterium]
MKIRYFVLLAVICAIAFASCASTAAYDASRFASWVDEEAIWRTVSNKSFKTGRQNAPTDTQINDIMKLVHNTPTSGGAKDFFFLVLKDPAQQQDVVGQGNASDGTITVMVFTDRVLANPPRNVPLSQDRGYVNAGFACGYFNLAALSYGYGTHYYLTPSGYYGNRPLRAEYVATDTKPPIEDVYLKGKGYQYFVDGNYAGNPTGNADGAYYDPYGNLKFVLAIVVGTLDDTADTQLTARGYPANWAYAK